MSLADAMKALEDAVTPAKNLLPLFKAGETLVIQRTVEGENVLMWVEVVDPCSISPSAMNLRAKILKYGTSAYADGRVDNQKRALDRLMTERERILELAVRYGVTEIVDLVAGEGD